MGNFLSAEGITTVANGLDGYSLEVKFKAPGEENPSTGQVVEPVSDPKPVPAPIRRSCVAGINIIDDTMKPQQSTTKQSTTKQSITKQSTTSQPTTSQPTTSQPTTEQKPTEQKPTEQKPTEEKIVLDMNKLDTVALSKLVSYAKQNRPKKLAVEDDYQTRIAGVDLVNRKLIPMNMEFRDKISKVLDPYTPPEGVPYKKKYVRYVKPQFGLDQVIALNSTGKKDNLGVLDVGTIPKPTTPFNVTNITPDEFTNSFRDPAMNMDMLGISKKILIKLPRYHKVRFVNCYNKLFNGTDSVADISFARSSFIYKDAKKGPKDDIKSFRQIMAIPNSVSHFHRILALRLNEYLDKNNYVDKSIQKGGVSGIKFGILEQIYKVKEAIKNANTYNKSACVMFLDISNAFGNLNVGKLADVMKKYHIPDVFINYIKTYYANFKYYVHSKNLNSDLLDWGDGLIQGCPLSPILFVLSLNYVLKYIDNKYKKDCGYTLSTAKILLTGYIDDICIVANSMKNLKKVFDDMKSKFAALGLPLNVSKCAIMKIFPIEDGTVIPDVPVVEHYKYLGEYISSNGDYAKSYKDFLRDLGKRLNQIERSHHRNDDRVTSFCTQMLPWIQRKMLAMYDLSRDDRYKVVSLIKRYMTKWGGNYANIKVFNFIFDILAKSEDNVITNMKHNTKIDEELRTDVAMANHVMQDASIEVGYDTINKKPVITQN
uniref:Reverse transcriptase n=1 Tax=Mimivirus LCMiAC01 TaxID=2506608 RepID=A0A481Z0V9_9VIRU|nr:MAG: reverse transcriptase [Mimivirus LCMiAC01]